MNEILKAREERSNLIKQIRGDLPVLIIKANTPGLKKNPPWAFFLVNYFYHLICRNFQIESEAYHRTFDGPFWILKLSEEEKLKEKLIEIEEEHPLGRLIDLDLFLKGEKISRRNLNHPERSCLICKKMAHICIRNMSHSLAEVNQKIDEILFCFYLNKITDFLDSSITIEAELDPKFGLVTKLSSGSHQDMDYLLLMRAKRAIIPSLIKIFKTAYYQDLQTAFLDARKYGLEAEEKMYLVTGNINAYKGLIFLVGIILACLGVAFKEYKFDIFEKVKLFGLTLKDDFKSKTFNTAGLKAYHRYGITGIRGEVIRGLPNVQKVLPDLDFSSRESLLMALITLIKDVEDTVLLKRAGSVERYNYYRQLIGNIKIFDEEIINDITKECILNNLSFGGSADLLIVAIFLKKVEGCFKLNYEGELSDWSL